MTALAAVGGGIVVTTTPGTAVVDAVFTAPIGWLNSVVVTTGTGLAVVVTTTSFSSENQMIYYITIPVIIIYKSGYLLVMETGLVGPMKRRDSGTVSCFSNFRGCCATGTCLCGEAATVGIGTDGDNGLGIKDRGLLLGPASAGMNALAGRRGMDSC